MDRLREEVKASRAARTEAAKTEKPAVADVDMETTANDEESKPLKGDDSTLAVAEMAAKPLKSASPSPALTSLKPKVDRETLLT